MPLPANFPAPPAPPVASVDLTDNAWRIYHARMNHYVAQLVAALKL